MAKRIVLHCTPYRLDVALYVGLTEQQVIARIKRDFKLTKDKLGDLDSHGLSFDGRNGHTLLNQYWAAVWLKRWQWQPKWISTLTHELFHVVAFVMEGRGIKLCDETDEAYAYLLESLVHQALMQL